MNSTTNMTNSNLASLALRGVAAAFLLACGAPAALGQQAELEGSFDQPLSARARAGGQGAAPSQPAVTSRSTMTFSDGTNTYTVRIEGDKTTAEVNGKAVPGERVRERRGEVEILDEQGGVLHTFTRPMTRAAAPRVQAWGGRIVPAVPAVPAVPGFEAMAPPPVMLGMLMNDAPDEEGIVVEAVFEGLPAAEAGLKAGDIIVSLDGKALAASSEVRSTLMKRNPGDKIEAVLRRDGQEVRATITLQAYDQERMNAAREKAQPNAAARFFRGGEGGGADWNMLGGQIDERVRKAMEEAIAALNEKDALLGNDQRARLSEKLEKALKDAERVHGMALNRWRAAEGPEGGRVIIGDGGGRVFTLPPAAPMAPASPMSPAQSDQLNQRLDRLMDYFDRLNERLDRLEKRLDEGKQP